MSKWLKVVAFEDEFTVHIFLRACDMNDIDAIRKYIRKGMDPNCHEGDFRTALHIAADNDYYKLIQYLVTIPNININAQNNWGVTPLYQACARNSIKIVLLLIQSHADVNLANKHDYTPLHCSVLMRHRELVKILLENGAEVNSVSIFGLTPLHFAVLDSPSFTTSELLIKHGADIDVNNGTSMPILLEGALSCQSYYQLESIIHFVSFGCDINIRDLLMGRTALHIVAITNYIPLAEFLISSGANKNIRDYDSKTPLCIAIKQRNVEMIQFLKYGKLDQNGNSLSADES